jgi:DNA-binding PadR family transcriptional regulator
MKANPSTEYVLLGTLFSGQKHGYEIMQLLESTLESTWRVSTSQLYVLLKRLEREGLVHSSLETQEARPSRRVFSLTRPGKTAFLSWLRSPTERVRDLRIEFPAKLFFFHRLSLKGGDELVSAQVKALGDIKKGIRKRQERENDPFEKLVLGMKAMTVDTWLRWLRKQATHFLREMYPHG